MKKTSQDIRLKSAEKLINIFRLFNINKNILIDNIGILREEGFIEVKVLLVPLSKRVFLWWELDLRDEIIGTLDQL